MQGTSLLFIQDVLNLVQLLTIFLTNQSMKDYNIMLLRRFCYVSQEYMYIKIII